MLVTVELLHKLKACNQGIRYIERFYPNGAEMIDIIRDKHISKEFLHWGREHLTSNEEELAAYCEACKIINTEGFWYSVNVQDSKYVIRSKNVTDSISIFNSADVQGSKDIVESENIADSKQVFYSSMIEECQKIFKGINISESINICNSTMVARSKSVIDSTNVFDSSEIIKSNTVTNSHFCQECYNIESCLFCYGLENAEYHIFNKPVDKNRYEVIEKQYKKYMNELLVFIRDWPQDLVIYTSTQPTRKFDDWYFAISKRFWKWVRTLPGFNTTMLYDITMLPEILTEN